MAPTVAPKAACIIRAWNNTTRHAARVTVCPLVPCRDQGRSAMAGGTRHIGFYYAATRARMTLAVAAKDACTVPAWWTTVRCPPVVPGPLARGSHCPPCPRPWKPPWFPMLAGGPQFASSPFDTSAFGVMGLFFCECLHTLGLPQESICCKKCWYRRSFRFLTLPAVS